ncbi:MAG: DUF3520 domain-containing protein [Lysobacteraceae bacterium]|nr:MAG: DUF3520 domain-containing protein [Xanthomonadaceae bacterium]
MTTEAPTRAPAEVPSTDQAAGLDRVAVTGSRMQRAEMESSRQAAAARKAAAPASSPAPPPMAYEQAAGHAYLAAAPLLAHAEPANTENYQQRVDNPVQRTSEQPVSTFSVDVDTGSYSNVRRMLREGVRPPADSVRAEEFINYFSYQHPAPADRSSPFRVTTELAATPWNPQRQLLMIGIKGYDVPKATLPPANLVFLLDTSGSMDAPDKLPLLAALERLQAGGSTNGGDGIRLAYAMARQGFIKDGVNRVILATDGDFNVGTVSQQALETMVGDQRKSGIALTTLGFGQGNYNDALAERLADVGDGNHAYIDTPQEARKVLVEEMQSTLLTIARDVKIQVEFNPALVSEYRLIGYENRVLQREDFANDKVDAGDIGAGHEVTALYEITPAGSAGGRLPALRYGDATPAQPKNQGEVAHLRLRYKLPGADNSRLIEAPILAASSTARPSQAFRFASAVAAYADLLRGGRNIDQWGWSEVAAAARNARGADVFGLRDEFVALVEEARRLVSPDGQAPVATSD